MFSLLGRLRNGLLALLTQPKYFWALAALVLVGDGLLTTLIIHFVPYTEIDWETYMIQIEIILKGEFNYSKVSGPTGPLVYPAGHVYIHSWLHNFTRGGKDLVTTQYIYATLYLASLATVCGIYRKAGAPNWLLLLLPLSKRLHSIYVLRLFNDCWAAFAAQAAVLALQNGMDDFGTLLLSAAISVKMSAILYLPGLLVILYKRRGLASTLRYLVTMVAFQMLIAQDFLQVDSKAYINGAFDLSRVFLYKWTVNWRMLGEDLFLDPRLAVGLLVGHVSILVAFGFRWCNADDGVFSTIKRGLRRPLSPAGLVTITANDVATILFTSNLLPFVVYTSRLPIPIKFVLP
ncbi:hypothetical protein ONZ45_g12220 [Pleurotus djamor]|nr:hypothetical protein ONZ45_g12220 [Pleurotus djamor]